MSVQLQFPDAVTGDGVLQALERILVSERFIASPRSCHFLRFIVENTLAGRAAELKESVIGLEVFERGASFDPRNDSVVRVEARRLRAKLADYYRRRGAGETVIIDLPKGGYVPHFRAIAQLHPVAGRKLFLIPILSAVLLLLTVAAVWFFQSKQEHSPQPEALESYRRGLYISQQRGEEHLAQSIDLFEQAIRLDPQFAAAHAALADVSATLAFRHGTVASMNGLTEKAREAARRALQLEPGRAEAWGTLGALAAFHDWDWNAAETAFRKGLKLNPREAGIHRWYSRGLSSRGRFGEALNHIKTAYSTHPTAFAMEIDLGKLYYAERRFSECVLQAGRAVAADPDYWPAHILLGRCYAGQGDYTRAISAFAAALKFSTGRPLPILGRLSHAYASAGMLPEARTMQAELLPRLGRGETGWVQLALLQVALKEYTKALDSLESAYVQHESELTYIAVEPLLDPLRTDARFVKLTRKLGLADLRR